MNARTALIESAYTMLFVACLIMDALTTHLEETQ